MEELKGAYAKLDKLCGTNSLFYRVTDRLGFTRPTKRMIGYLEKKIGETREEAKRVEDESVKLRLADVVNKYEVAILNSQIQDSLVVSVNGVIKANSLEKVINYIKNPKGKEKVKRDALRRMQHCIEKKYGYVNDSKEKISRILYSLADEYKTICRHIDRSESDIVKVYKDKDEGQNKVERLKDKLRSRYEELSSPTTREEELEKEIAGTKEELEKLMNSIREVDEILTACKQQKEKYDLKKEKITQSIEETNRKKELYLRWSGFYETVKRCADKLDDQIGKSLGADSKVKKTAA
jgi:chromosome segregation ATPase